MIPVVLIFPEFLLVSAYSGRSKTAESGIFAQKMDVLGPKIFAGGNRYSWGVQPLTNNTAKTSIGEEDLVKIRPAVAEQSRRKKKKQVRQ